MSGRGDNSGRFSVRLEVDLLSLDETRTVNYQDLLRSALEKLGEPTENGSVSHDAPTADRNDSFEDACERGRVSKTPSSEASDDVNRNQKYSQEGSSEDQAVPHHEIEIVRHAHPVLPEGLPPGVEQLVSELITAFFDCKLTPRKFFAQPVYSTLFFNLAKALREMGPVNKGLVYEYLAYFLPLKKKTLVVRMKKILKEHRALIGEKSSLEPSTSEKMANNSSTSQITASNILSQLGDEGPSTRPEMVTITKVPPLLGQRPQAKPSLVKPDYKAIDFQSMEMTRKDVNKPTKSVELKLVPLPEAFCSRSSPRGRERNELLFMIKNVLSHYLPSRHNFFTCCLTPLIYALEDYIKLKPELTQYRSQIYDHLSYYTPCSREGLISALSKLLERKRLCDSRLRSMWCEFEPTKDGHQGPVDTTPAVHGNEDRFKFSQEKHKSREDLKRKVDSVLETPSFFTEPSAEFRETVIKANALFSFQHFESRIGQKAYEFAQKCTLGNQLESSKTNCALPDELTPKMEIIICDIKQAASAIKHFNKDFYECPVLPALHELDVLSRRYLKPTERRQMYEHLSTFLPCDTKNLLKLVDGLYEPHICFIMHFRRQRKEAKAARKQLKKTGESSQESRSKTDVQKMSGTGGHESKPQAVISKNSGESKGPKMIPQAGTSSRSQSTSKPEVEIFKVPQPVCDSDATRDESKAASEKIVSILEEEQTNIEETNTAINVLSQIFTDQDVVVDGWNDSERPEVSTSPSADDHLQQLLQDLKDLKQLTTDRR